MQNKELKKANQEYEKLLAEISAEHRKFLENYMDIVDHAHFQEQESILSGNDRCDTDI